jgi:protein-disulfide isomerase
VRGEGREAVVYLDLACPHCAATWARLGEQPLRLVFRHFPVASKHPRAPALHTAVEAAALQGSEEAFWALVDSIYRDQGRVDDPHLWERAKALGLDIERFERDRRSDAVSERVRRDFEGGIRAGVIGTPAAFLEGLRVAGDLASELAL